MSLEIGEARRVAALLDHEVTKPGWLKQARDWAYAFALQNGEVTTDDVREGFPIPEGMHPSVAGAIFRDARFRCTAWRKSRRDEANARRIGVYVLRAAP